MFIVIVLCFYLLTPMKTETPLNIAPFTTAESTSTCGTPPAISCPIFEPPGIDEDLYERCYWCNSSNYHLAHPIINILLGSKTWWQSANSDSKVNITIELGQKFAVYSLVIEFGPSPNPRQWTLEKSIDGQFFVPWRYFGDEKFCQDIQETLTKNDKIFCISKYSKLFNNGQVVVKLTEDESKFTMKLDLQLQTWIEATHIRLQFNQLQTLSGIYYPKDGRFESRLYYTIRNIEIYAKAVCPPGYLTVPVDKIPPFCLAPVQCPSCVLDLVKGITGIGITEWLLRPIENVYDSDAGMKLLHNAVKLIHDDLDPAVASLVTAYDLLKHEDALTAYVKGMTHRINRLLCKSSNKVEILSKDLIPRLETLEDSIPTLIETDRLLYSNISNRFQMELLLAKNSLQAAKEYLTKVKISASNVKCDSTMFPTSALLRSCISSLQTARIVVETATIMLQNLTEFSEHTSIQLFFKVISVVNTLRNAISDELEPVIRRAKLLTYLKHFGDFISYPTLETLNVTEKTLKEATNILDPRNETNDFPINIVNDQRRFYRELNRHVTKLQLTHSQILSSKYKLQQRLAELMKLKNYSKNLSKTARDIEETSIAVQDIDNDLNFPILLVNRSEIEEILALANRALEFKHAVDLDRITQKFRFLKFMETNSTLDYSHVTRKVNETTNASRKVRDLTRKTEHRKTIAGRLFGNVRHKINNLRHNIGKARKIEKSLFKPHHG